MGNSNTNLLIEYRLSFNCKFTICQCLNQVRGLNTGLYTQCILIFGAKHKTCMAFYAVFSPI